MGTHKASKKLKTAWLEPEEINSLQELARSFGVDFTKLLQKIAHGEITVARRNSSSNKEK